MFWLIAGMMIVTALLFVVLPLLREAFVQVENRSQQNIQIAKEQLGVLKRSLDQGSITDKEYLLARRELEESLHSDLENRDESTVSSVGIMAKTAGALMLLLPGSVIALYFFLGSPEAMDSQSLAKAHLSVAAVSPDKGDIGQKEIKMMVARLEKKLAANPENGEGWLMLGRSYSHFKQFSKAASAFKKAISLMPGNSEAQKGLAHVQTALEVSVVASKKEDVLSPRPDNVADWMARGRNQMEQKQYKEAIASYQKVVDALPDDPGAMLALADALAMLQHGKIAGRPEVLVHKALEKSPEHPIALWLAGMAAREHQNYRQALDYWHKLIPLLKPGSADKLELEKLIRQVEGRL